MDGCLVNEIILGQRVVEFLMHIQVTLFTSIWSSGHTYVHPVPQ